MVASLGVVGLGWQARVLPMLMQRIQQQRQGQQQLAGLE
jgi:hypothetical protein